MKINENKGITLVALVVTVIILLILSGISIASLTGNGLFEKAKLAKEKQENSQNEENTKLLDYDNCIDSQIASNRNLNLELDYDNAINISSNLNGENKSYTFNKFGQLCVVMGINGGGYYYSTISHNNNPINYIRFHNSASSGEQYTDHTLVNPGDTILVTHYSNVQGWVQIMFIPFK